MITWYLLGLSAVTAIMGVMGLVPSLDMGAEPGWHAVLKIVLGAIGVIIALRK